MTAAASGLPNALPNRLPNAALVPFAVAVTGHRDLRPDDLDALAREVRLVLTALQVRMPSTPLVLLSALAEGADQFVAEVALQMGITLAAVLPMPLEIYAQTMPAAAQERLHAQLAQSATRTILPSKGGTDEQLLDSEDARALCYEELGWFLVRQSQAMIAMWDGKHSPKRGGTSQVVDAVRLGLKEEGEAEPRCGVVYQVVTPRVSGTDTAPAICTLTLVPEARKTTHSGEEEPRQNSYAEVEINIERFNREAIRRLRDPACTPGCLVDDPGVVLSPFQLRLQTLYGAADVISFQANRLRKLFLLLILLVAFAGTIFYGIHGEILEPYVFLWFSFPLFVVAAYVLYRVASSLHVEESYLDARALAEALRVQFFWAMAGIREPVDPYYLTDHRTELDWIRVALKNVWLLHDGLDEDRDARPNCRVVLEKWVKDQMFWYRRKSGQQTRIVHERERISRVTLWVAMVWSILVPASVLIKGPWYAYPPWIGVEPGPNHWMYQSLHIALAVPALLAAGFRLWTEQSGYEEQAREYRYMEKVFQATAKDLEAHLDSPEVAEKLLRDLGIEELKENARWLLLHRERPLEVMSSP